MIRISRRDFAVLGVAAMLERSALAQTDAGPIITRAIPSTGERVAAVWRGLQDQTLRRWSVGSERVDGDNMVDTVSPEISPTTSNVEANFSISARCVRTRLRARSNA
jgi:hypothetical protein